MANRMTMRWNVPANCWIVDIADSSGAPVVTGLAVVTGSDLLEQYGYLLLGGQLVAQTDHDVQAVPTFQNMGRDGHLYYLSP